jgi:hypothetical protein
LLALLKVVKDLLKKAENAEGSGRVVEMGWGI